MPNYIWAFLIAAAAALLFTPIVIRLAFRTGALDAPDARKVHKKPIPRIGGLAIYAAFMVSMLLLLETAEIPEETAQESSVFSSDHLRLGGGCLRRPH